MIFQQRGSPEVFGAKPNSTAALAHCQHVEIPIRRAALRAAPSDEWYERATSPAGTWQLCKLTINGLATELFRAGAICWNIDYVVGGIPNRAGLQAGAPCRGR